MIHPFMKPDHKYDDSEMNGNVLANILQQKNKQKLIYFFVQLHPYSTVNTQLQGLN